MYVTENVTAMLVNRSYGLSCVAGVSLGQLKLCATVLVVKNIEDFGGGDGGPKGDLKVVPLYSEGWCSEETLKILVEVMVVL